uniref:C2H2-type domain-containing protein n=1 Tax=Macrostomum lignano TaxID=282301 RepID=A0A1I8FNX8_9PLAT
MAICKIRLRRGRSQLLFDDGLCRQFIDSSASSASHQFQEIFPPLADIDIGAYGDDSGGGGGSESFDAEDAPTMTARRTAAISASSCCSLPASELVAASAEFCLCANCGLCCQGADRMRAHKTASGHLGSACLRADPFDTFKCAQCADQLESRQAVLRHVALHEEKRPKMTAPPAGAAVAAVPSAPSGPFDCAVCGRGLPAVSDLTAHAAQTGHSQFKAQRRLSRGQEALPAQSKRPEPPAAVGSSAPSPVVTLARPSSCPCACSAQPGLPELLLRMSTANGLAIIRFRLFSTGAASAAGHLLQVSAVPPANETRLEQVASHISRFSPPRLRQPGRRLFAAWQMGRRPGRTLAEESAAADMASRSLQLAVARQNLGLPYSVKSLPDLPPHLNAAHRRRVRCAQKPILLLRTVRPACAGICQTVCASPACSLCDRCFPSEAQLRRHRDRDHSTTTLPPPVKRRGGSCARLSILAPPRRKTRDHATTASAVVLHVVWRRIHHSLSALRSHHSECAGEQLAGVQMETVNLGL